MSRVRQIIDRARQALADPEKNRWTDENLLLLLSEAQQDMSIKCLLLKKKYGFSLIDGQDTYRLPTDFIKLETAWVSAEDSRDKVLEVVNYKDVSPFLGSSVGNLPSHILVGLDNRENIKLWPIPKPDTRNILDTKELFGVLTDFKNVEIDQPFGVITHIDVADIKQTGTYGIVTDLLKVLGEVHLWYYYKPEYLKSMEDELLVADTCDIGLKHYIVGMAMRDDMDSRNRMAAAEELTLYQLEVKRNVSDRAVNFTQNNANLLATSFRTGFNQ